MILPLDIRIEALNLESSVHSGIFTYAVFVHSVLGSLPNQWARASHAG